MPVTAFSGARIFDGLTLHEGRALLVEGGRVVGLEPAPGPPEARRVALQGGILAPGFIDAQVNGGGGVMLNDAPTRETMALMAAAHRRFGTTTLLPTLITDSPDKTAAALAAAADPPDGVAGLHLEGPHLAPARKGAHRTEFMRPMTEADLAACIAARRRLDVLLLTVAAEAVSPAQVARLTAAGVTVSLGHSDATAEEAAALFDAGARGVTHLFNAMSGLGHRSPGIVGAALDRPGVWAGVIADGHHVDPVALRVALAAKRGPGRLFLVTDAMAGPEAEAFTLQGRPVRRREGTGGACPRLELADGTLAGSALDMPAALRFCVGRLGLPLADALRRATADPADFLGLPDRGRLTPGARADLVHLTDGLQVVGVWQAAQTP